MTGALARQRCFLHEDREAAFRCPSCRRHYCRECGVEHEGRILCAACLKKLAAPRTAQPVRWGRVGVAVSPALGFLIAWLVFFYLGEWLLSIPTAFHEGKLP